MNEIQRVHLLKRGRCPAITPINIPYGAEEERIVFNKKYLFTHRSKDDSLKFDFLLQILRS